MSLTTTSKMKSKGFRCAACMEWSPIVTKGADGKMRCDACVDERRRSPVTISARPVEEE